MILAKLALVASVLLVLVHASAADLRDTMKVEVESAGLHPAWIPGCTSVARDTSTSRAR
jgi:hypothetical protein